MITQDLIAEIQELTEHNQHTESLMLVADAIKARRELQVLTSIKTIQDYQGELVRDLSELRYQIMKRLVTLTEQKFGQQAAESVYNAL